MIAYVKGKVLSASNGTIVLERDGLGFEIICSATSFKRLVESGEGAVYTYLAVRDDGKAHFYAIEWKTETGETGTNHYLQGAPQFDYEWYMRNLKKMNYDEFEGFDA